MLIFQASMFTKRAILRCIAHDVLFTSALTPYHFLKRSYEYDSLLGCIGPPYSEFLAQPQKDMFMWVKRNMSLAMPTWMRQGFCLNSLLEISEKMGQNREKWSKRRSYSYEYDNYRGCTM